MRQLQKFEATMFVTLKYKGTNMDRNPEETKNKYIENIKKNGVEITSCEIIKEDKKSGRHDGYGYATGNYYKIIGEIEACKTKSGTRFQIFHKCRGHDYWCVSPVLYNSIRFI